MAAVFGIFMLMVLFVILHKYRAVIFNLTSLLVVVTLFLIFEGDLVGFHDGDLFRAVILLFGAFVLIFLIHVAKDFLFGAIRMVSADESEYSENKKALFKFFFKWLIIYFIFGFFFEMFLRLFMSDDSAMGFKLAFGSRVFLALLLIIKISQWRKELMSDYDR